jgi:AraC family transcriptional regulator, alkane utilization regulator
MDAVSDVLRVVRLGGAVYLSAEFTAPWCVISQTDAALCEAYLPQSERVVSYHLITEGHCWAQLPDNPDSRIHLDSGELLVVPQGETHILGSTIDHSPVPVAPLLAAQLKTAPGQVMKLSYGGGNRRTGLVCGFLACDDTLTNPLLSSLPRIFKVDMRDDPHSAWLESSLRFAAVEAGELRAGSAIILAKLSELLFVEAVRRCIDTLPADRTGWLAAVRDRFIGRALSMLHAQPAYPWTVDELARRTGLSRSALAQRFTDLIGQPPMQYLARWRLLIAAHEILIGTGSVAAVAERVGYDSEAAFNRAFKREFGMPPVSWRNSRKRADTTGASANAVDSVSPAKAG